MSSIKRRAFNKGVPSKQSAAQGAPQYNLIREAVQKGISDAQRDMGVIPTNVFAGTTDLSNLSEAQVMKVLASDNGKKIFQQKVDAELEKHCRSITEQITQEWNEKLSLAEDCTAAFSQLSVLSSIEAAYQKAAEDPSRKGFAKTRLTLKELFGTMDGNGVTQELTMDGAKEMYKRFREEYGFETLFSSDILNGSLGLEALDPFVDDSVFDGLSGWDIYRMALTDGDISSRIIDTVGCCVALMEYDPKRFGPNTLSGITKKVNAAIKEMIDDPHKFVETVRKINGIVGIPKTWVRHYDRYMKMLSTWRQTERWNLEMFPEELLYDAEYYKGLPDIEKADELLIRDADQSNTKKARAG